MTPNAAKLLKDMLKPCSGCGVAVLEDPCWECVKARAKTATTGGRCTCPKSKRRERSVKTTIRAWVACDRCLGVVRNLPDPPRRTT